MKPVAVVVGHPAGHSRSPAIFRHWFRCYGIAGNYETLDVRPEQLEWTLLRLALAGVRGANVTMPHKERAAQIAHACSKTVQRLGAANLLSFSPTGLIVAGNSDGFGFLESLRSAVPDWRPDRGHIVVLGAGGAALAVCDALACEGIPELRIVNRTLPRAEAIAARLEGNLVAVPWGDLGLALQDAAMVVNCTSLGMKGQPDLEIDLADTQGDAVVADIVYAPQRTALLAQAELLGRRAIPGTGMLLHQARPAFERWFGVAPEVDAELVRAVFGDPR